MSRAKGVGIGELRHRITIEYKTKTSDDQGGFTWSWRPLATVWAKIEAAPKSERNFAGKLETQRTHKITIRYLENLDPSMRIKNVETEVIYQIKNIIQIDNQRFWLRLDAEENQGT